MGSVVHTVVMVTQNSRGKHTNFQISDFLQVAKDEE